MEQSIKKRKKEFIALFTVLTIVFSLFFQSPLSINAKYFDSYNTKDLISSGEEITCLYYFHIKYKDSSGKELTLFDDNNMSISTDSYGDSTYSYKVDGIDGLDKWIVIESSYDGAGSYLTLQAVMKTFAVRYADEDGSIFNCVSNYEKIAYGTTTPSYSSLTGSSDAEPSKAEDEHYTYEFEGWMDNNGKIVDPTSITVTADATYTASYKKTPKKFPITWMDEEGNVIDTTQVDYGSVPTYEDQTKAATPEYTYTFAGWDPSPVAVTGPATYTATFDAKKNEYKITFVDYDDSTLSEVSYEYGTSINDVYIPDDPERESDAQYTYEFSNWTPDFPDSVSSDSTFKAEYTQTLNIYDITWKNDDGSVIDTTKVAYGQVPTHENATKAATADYTYTFTGWDKELVAVTGPATYQAVFSEEAIPKEETQESNTNNNKTDVKSTETPTEAPTEAPTKAPASTGPAATAPPAEKTTEAAPQANVTKNDTTNKTSPNAVKTGDNSMAQIMLILMLISSLGIISLII
ncbi:MAG: hypothetical protein K6E10_02525, partial [Eubacterium sp.]|nr:hypothetical protein [Eubacterium sp.]